MKKSASQFAEMCVSSSKYQRTC